MIYDIYEFLIKLKKQLLQESTTLQMWLTNLPGEWVFDELGMISATVHLFYDGYMY